jgi:DNA-directed RNA polymerase specialized sigma24 family protein
MTEPVDHHPSWDDLFDLKNTLTGWIHGRAPAFDPEEIFQEVMLKAYRSHPDAATLVKPLAYLKSAARTVIADRVEQENTNRVGSLEDLSEGSKKQLECRWTKDWLAAVKREKSRDALDELASELKPRDRLVLKLKLEEVSWEEMARVLGTDLAGARLRWASVLDKLHYIVKKKAAKQQTRRD